MKIVFVLGCLFTVCSVYPTEVHIPDLSDSSIEQVRKLYEEYPRHMIIRVEPKQNLIQKVTGWTEWIFGTQQIVTESSSRWFSLKSVMQWIFGGTCVSYLAGLYIIYRAYLLVKKINSLISWAYGEEDNEVVLYVRRMKNKKIFKRYREKVRNEKEILRRYITLHNKLEKAHIRWIFPHNRVWDELIIKRLQTLEILEQNLQYKE